MIECITSSTPPMNAQISKVPQFLDTKNSGISFKNM